MRGFVVFFCYWAVSSAYILRQEKDEEWKTRKTLQNKAYTAERREQTARRTIWTQNLKVRHETVILVTHFYFLLFQWRCTFNLAHIYEKRRDDYVAKVRITFQTISDERQIMKQQPQARQAGPLFTWPLFSYRLRSEQCCIERYRWMLRRFHFVPKYCFEWKSFNKSFNHVTQVMCLSFAFSGGLKRWIYL